MIGDVVLDIPDYSGPGVYALVDESGKRYVGSSKNVCRRVTQHLVALSRAKEGDDNTRENKKLVSAVRNGVIFRATVLERLELGGNQYDLWDLERKHICLSGGVRGTYNVRDIQDFRESDMCLFNLWAKSTHRGSARCACDLLEMIWKREEAL